MTLHNPNWVAFAASEGVRPEDLPAGAETNAAYINWISEQAADFTAKTGITKETHPGEYPALFSEWLTDAYPTPDDDEPRRRPLPPHVGSGAPGPDRAVLRRRPTGAPPMTATVLGRWEPGSPEWHAARAHGVGGSEVAAVVGCSPFESRFSLWHRKAQLVGPVDESPEMEWGKRLEPAIAAKFMDEHPELAFDRTGYTFAHEDRPWQIANPDLYGDALVEVKCSRDGLGWGKPGTDQVPIYYRQQVLWYCDTLGAPGAHVAVLVGGNDYREYYVEYDPVEAAELRGHVEAFLGTLERHERPDIDDHTATFQVVRELHPDIDGTDVEVDDELAARFTLARRQVAQAEAAEQYARNLLADALGSARRARWDGKTIAYRQSKQGGLPYLVAGRSLPDPDDFHPSTITTITEQDPAA